jgi:hypothetical protein
MSVVIKEVTSKKELKKFVKFNIELYKGNPYHVPGLIEEEMVTLDKKKNPAQYRPDAAKKDAHGFCPAFLSAAAVLLQAVLHASQ